MPHISRRKLKKSTEKDLIDSLQIVLTKISTKDTMDVFLTALLSHTEKLMLAKRLAIVVLLKEGFSDSEISDLLYVTRETVARIRMQKELRGEGFLIALKKLEEETQWKQFKKVLFSLARYSARASRGTVKPTILD